MHLTEQKRGRLIELGEELLTLLTAVSAAATAKLAESVASPDCLINPEANARQHLAAISSEVRQSLNKLRIEPMIARVVVEWQDTEPCQEIVYVCRGSAAGMASAVKGGQFASYRSPIGRLAELQTGDHELIPLPRSAGEREARIVESAAFHPLLDAGGWDASNGKYAFLTWHVALQSVRRFLQEIGRAPVPEGAALLERVLAEAAADDIVREKIRRQTIDRIALRDQALLDSDQGHVSRLPMNNRLVLLGPPGTGKTTTLIKRIAQKLTVDELGDEERRDILASGLDVSNWVMYTPTELLKLYLRDSFNKEDVPADSRNLRTWEWERMDLGRNILSIIRGASGGRYILTTGDESILRDPSSQALSQLHDKFSDYMIHWVISRCEKSIAQIKQLEGTDAEAALNRIPERIRSGSITLQNIFDLANDRDLIEDVRRLSQRTSEMTRSLASHCLDKQILKNLIVLLRDLESRGVDTNDVEEEFDDEDEDVTTIPPGLAEGDYQRRAIEMLQTAIRRLAEDTAQGRNVISRSKTERILQLLGDRVPSKTDSGQLGRLLIVRNGLRRLSRSARDLVYKAPTAYGRFRRDALKEKKQWYRNDIQSQLSTNRLSPLEADVLILYMLRAARQIGGEVWESPWLDRIRDRYAIQVYIDEATDFSAVQLACMLELAHPKLRSWFACGDFQQRITASGITEPDEFGWIQKQTRTDEIIRRDVKKYYRQSPRLVALANELAKLQGSVELPAEPSNTDFCDYPPLCMEEVSGNTLAKWLSERVLEIERAVGYLPSIGVFVDGDERIDALVENVGRYLEDHGLRIVGCKDGRVVGDTQEVRVFDVKHIKGLEFEAVFFVGIDNLARRLPDLFDRYLYVALTRAATYLAMTSEGKLPHRLETLRSHFLTTTWTR